MGVSSEATYVTQPNSECGGYIDCLVASQELEALNVVKRMGRITVSLWYLPYLLSIAPTATINFCVQEYPSIGWRNVQTAAAPALQQFTHRLLTLAIDYDRLQYFSDLYLDYLLMLTQRKSQVCQDSAFVAHYIKVLLYSALTTLGPLDVVCGSSSALPDDAPSSSKNPPSGGATPPNHIPSYLSFGILEDRGATTTAKPTMATESGGRVQINPENAELATQHLKVKRMETKIKDIIDHKHVYNYSTEELRTIFIEQRYFKGLLLLNPLNFQFHAERSSIRRLGVPVTDGALLAAAGERRGRRLRCRSSSRCRPGRTFSGKLGPGKPDPRAGCVHHVRLPGPHGDLQIDQTVLADAGELLRNAAPVHQTGGPDVVAGRPRAVSVRPAAAVAQRSVAPPPHTVHPHMSR
eukprot:NODE_379_length_1418_cov_245.453616_g279_i0.p1 GENE.NODE_379_length_1418_cov_245.453616_g279_i0~~NODE_379_length_1418_cov_245.453616_g279_i0.p1  ORF type:complete len:408 (-),score=80.12 NODE_379_length_1418_cov_245.453616_g279_i0:162-1385(-)